MNFSDDFFDPESSSYIDDEKLKSKVRKCKEYVSNGQTIAHLGNIENTIQLCLEYDFIDDGIFLTEAALEISPYSSELWHSKGIFYNNMFEFEKAYLCFNKALSLNPSDVEAMINKSIAEDNLGMWDEAIITLENALLLEPNNEEVLFNLGIFYERNNYFEKAIEYFSKTVIIDKNYGDSWYELGFCYESNGQLDEAKDAYEKFLEIEPYSASGWYNIGIVFLRKNNYHEAIRCFELATAINDDFANAWFNCGLAYTYIHNYNESRNAFLKAFELDPFDDLIPLNIAQTFVATGDYVSAKKYYKETLKISKSSIDAYVGLGNCFAKENNRNKMLENFSMVIKLTLNNSLTEHTLPQLVQQLKEHYTEICTSKDSLLSLEELEKLGDNYFKIGKWDDAFNTYIKIIQLNIENSNIYYRMALTQFMLNNNEEALNFLLHSFDLNSGMEVNFLDNFPHFESTQLYIKLTDAI